MPQDPTDCIFIVTRSGKEIAHGLSWNEAIDFVADAVTEPFGGSISEYVIASRPKETSSVAETDDEIFDALADYYHDQQR